jgi:hypothetical protein
MMKRLGLMVLILILLSFIANSATIVEYNETDFINLRPVASDADNDFLTYFFSPPLSNKGTWQTTYGDAGTYYTKVSVSDGRSVTTENITLVICKKEMPPEIKIISPVEKVAYVREGDKVFFEIIATDINKDSLSISWFLDDALVSNASSFEYAPDFYSAGEHSVVVLVSDGTLAATNGWNVKVERFDRSILLENLTDVYAKETDLISLELPDFKSYGLNYSISEPFNNTGTWQTGYNSAGAYSIDIEIWDSRAFLAKKSIVVYVENVDRPSSPLPKNDFWISEDEQLDIPLNYTDPDGDYVTLSVGNLPGGVVFENNALTWKPSFDTVTKQAFQDDIAKKYHILNRLFIIDVNATSRNLTIFQNIRIRVFDVNRQPVLENIPDVTVQENETVFFALSASDPDNDSLSFSFEGKINKNGYKTSYQDAGSYQVKITASDGFLSDSKYAKVTILPVNQQPVLKEIFPITADEGNLIEINLDASDADNDELSYSASSLPEGSSLIANKFSWKPGFDVVSGQKSKNYEIYFTVSDGILNDTKKAVITVNNVNHAPQILTSSQIDGMEFYKGELINFNIEAFDQDKDALSYSWDLAAALPASVQSGNNSKIVQFNSPGKKKVSVTVSDGQYSSSREWNIVIKERPKVKLVYLK